jgi:hypothetical protein
MIYQTQISDNNFEHLGCAFDSLAYAREKLGGKSWTIPELTSAWTGARAMGILDPTFTITDWQALTDYLKLPLRFLGKYDVNKVPVFHDGTKLFVITKWHNDRTNFDHFVIGQSRPVEWDPIEGGSITVKEGYPVSNRVFKII